MNKQSKVLLGLAAGGVVIGGGAYLYTRNKVAADSKTGLTPLTKNSIDARYITCNAADAKIDPNTKAIKGDNGLYYRGDVKLSLATADVKTDAKYVRNGTTVVKTDGTLYDTKPTVTADAKVFKNDDGKYLKSDGKAVASVYTQYKLAKSDGKLYTLNPDPISSNGPVFIVNGAEVVCTTDGRAYPIADSSSVVVPSLTPQN